MARYKSYDYAQVTMVPVSLEEQLEAGTLEHTIHDVVEKRLDLTGFDQQRANDETGRPGYDPRKQQYKSKRRWFGAEDFSYDARSKQLTCPAGKRLYGTGREVSNSQGHLVSHYKAAKTACLNCALRERCLRKPESGNPRQVRAFRGRVTETLTSRMKAKIDTPKGRALYSRRLGIVEPVFGNLAAQKAMNRSTLRGTAKVSIQWKLYCIVHNLEKVAKGAGMRN